MTSAACVQGAEGDKITAQVVPAYPNCAVQLALFMHFALNGWGPARFDDLHCQLDALDWWDGLCDKVEREAIKPTAYRQSPQGMLS